MSTQNFTTPKGHLARQGFTLVEILVAIALLGILAAVLTATLTGALGLNRQAQKQIDTASQVQAVLENIRNAWTVQDSYDRACAPGVTLPSGYTVKFVNLSSRAQPITQSNSVASPATAAPSNTLNISSGTTCTTSANSALTDGSIPVMRRVTVQSGTLPAGSPSGTAPTVGPQDLSLTLDLLRPQ